MELLEGGQIGRHSAIASVDKFIRFNLVDQSPPRFSGSYELFGLTVSAMNGCGMCIDSHERVLLQHGVKPEAIQSAVRVAAVMKAIATVHAVL